VNIKKLVNHPTFHIQQPSWDSFRVVIEMATITETTTKLTAPVGRLFSQGPNFKYGDFRDDLLRDGYAVIKGAVPRDRALKYADDIYQWLEDLYLDICPHRTLRTY
jgi:hypothetical protein